VSTVWTSFIDIEETVTTDWDGFVRTAFDPVQCDGSTRLSLIWLWDDTDTETHTLATPIISTWLSDTFTVTEYSTRDIPSPTCSINPSDCASLATAIGSAYNNILTSWWVSNVLTISLASPPTLVVVNGETTAIAGSAPYTLTVHNATYAPISALESVYLISDADSASPYDKRLTPGGQVTASWNYPGADYWDFELPCERPSSSTATCASSMCIVFAEFVDLSYFAPPPTTRDLCANTSPGYNRCR
jgi:hypothetical protein